MSFPGRLAKKVATIRRTASEANCASPVLRMVWVEIASVSGGRASSTRELGINLRISPEMMSYLQQNVGKMEPSIENVDDRPDAWLYWGGDRNNADLKCT